MCANKTGDEPADDQSPKPAARDVWVYLGESGHIVISQKHPAGNGPDVVILLSPSQARGVAEFLVDLAARIEGGA